MLDNEKVRLMTKISMYEVGKGKADLKKAQFYEKDYVSYHNFNTQISITFAVLLIMGIELSSLILSDLSALPTVNYKWFLIKYGIIWLLGIVVYTIINTKISRKEYSKAKERIETYEKLLKELEEIQE